MIYPDSLEELTTYVKKGKNVSFFIANWYGDCRFIESVMPEVEEAFPTFQFIEVDRDQSIDVTTKWNIFGILSFTVIESG